MRRRTQTRTRKRRRSRAAGNHVQETTPVHDLVKALQALLEAKQALAAKVQELVQGLGHTLPGIGYELVPIARVDGKPAARRGPGQATGSFVCPHCSRRFARAMHLGRHMAAAHRWKTSSRRASPGKAHKQAT